MSYALFESGDFVSSAGLSLSWKIECDRLAEEDWRTLATVVARKIHFSVVEGVPCGGLPFERALRPHATQGGCLLIVDDVLTTGESMERHRAVRAARGVVLFDRSGGHCPDWVVPLFSVGGYWL